MSALSAWMDFSGGLLAMGYLVCALFFLKFWRRIGDSLFLYFAGGFALLALQQAASALMTTAEQNRAAIYLIRLLAFLLIVSGLLRNVMRRRT